MRSISPSFVGSVSSKQASEAIAPGNGHAYVSARASARRRTALSSLSVRHDGHEQLHSSVSMSQTRHALQAVQPSSKDGGLANADPRSHQVAHADPRQARHADPYQADQARDDPSW